MSKRKWMFFYTLVFGVVSYASVAIRICLERSGPKGTSKDLDQLREIVSDSCKALKNT